jgi:hypothetical protein
MNSSLQQILLSSHINNTINVNILQNLEKEFNQMKYSISSLSTENQQLQAQLTEQLQKVSTLKHVESENNNLNEIIKSKDKEIEKLQNEIIQKKKENKSLAREIEFKFENQLGYYKGLNETNSTRIDAANSIIKLNERQHNTIIKLENKIDEIKKAEEEFNKQQEIIHENKFTNLKKKMMDHIKNAQKNMTQSNLDNLDLNTKLSKLATNQLLIELEEQSVQIEDLIKIKEKYEKEIFELKMDLKTHIKVETILQEKNKRYLNMVKACDEKIKKAEAKKIFEDKTRNLSSDTEQRISEMNTIGSVNNDGNYSKNKNGKKNDGYQNFKKYEKLYKNLFKNYENLKGQYNSLKDKFKLYNEKFSGIINLYKFSIDELIKDEEFKNKKEINVNLDEISKGNFENFNKFEKYSILVYLMKHLLPLINNESDYEINNIKQTYNNIEINFNKNNNINNKFYRTFNSFGMQKNKMNLTGNNFFVNNNNTNTYNNIFNNEKKNNIESYNNINIKNVNNNFKNTNSISNRSLSNMNVKYQTFTKFPKINKLLGNNSKEKKKETKQLYRFLNINYNNN